MRTADTVQISLRIPSEWVELADAEAVHLSRPGFEANRTDALRAAIARGLEAFAEDRARQKRAEEDSERPRVMVEKRKESELLELVASAGVYGLRASFVAGAGTMTLTDGKRTLVVDMYAEASNAIASWPGSKIVGWKWDGKPILRGSAEAKKMREDERAVIVPLDFDEAKAPKPKK